MKRSRLLFFCLLFLAAATAAAATLVNINTASKDELKTLDGVGDSIAQSIIDNRPYDSIEEISRASGIGAPGSSSYEKIKNFITVAGAPTTPPVAQETATTTTASSTVTTEAQPVTSASIIPPITVRIVGESSVTAGAGSLFSATAYGTEGAPLSGARILWNFGDGATTEGAKVMHTFAYPGRYVVSATAAYNYSVGLARLIVTATTASVSLEAGGDGSLLVRNLSSKELDVGLWVLVDAGKTYVVPEGTVILAGEGIRFSATVTNLAGSRAATLQYPNGASAAAAAVAASSPLRGERVSTQAFVPQTAAPPAVTPVSIQTPKAETQLAAVAATDLPTGTSSFWISFAALLALLGTAVAGVRYLQPQKETSLTADEFEIE